MFEPSHHLTFDTVALDRKRLLLYLQSPDVHALHLDLKHVVQCDSAGLALLIEACRLCRRYNKAFKIESMPKAIDALAEFCGVDVMLRADSSRFVRESNNDKQ